MLCRWEYSRTITFAQITVDVWNDKVFYQEKEFPAGFMAASILNIS